MTKFFTGYTARSAFDGGVGSRVTMPDMFRRALAEKVEAFDFNAETNEHVRTTGQGFIRFPEGVGFVSAGVGRKTNKPEHYVIREWRGEVKAYLKREHAVPAETLAVVVYTGAAYVDALGNPDTPADVAETERKAFEASGATHAIVAVLAGAGPEALSPGRLVSNLAGGNADAETWTADEIRAKAREAVAYSSEWAVVSD